MKNTFLFLIVLSSFNMLAQDLGQVKFFVDSDDGYFEIVINDTLYLKQYKDSLPAGLYNAKIWAPGYVVNEQTFQIISNKVTEVHPQLTRTNDYQEYEVAYKKYRNNFHKSLTLPLSVTFFSAVYSSTTMLRMYNFRKKTTDELALYSLSSSTNEIVNIKSRINDFDAKFRRNRTLFYTGSIVSGVGLAYTIYSYIKFKRNSTEPTYNKNSPFKDRFSFFPNTTGLTLKLKLG